MKTSEKGLALIMRHEALSLKAYKCPAGIWTIGYGHTRDVKAGDVCTKQQAVEWLMQDVKTAEAAINNAHLPINQNQFDALVSFVFNVGIGNFKRSTLLKKIRANAFDKNIEQQFMRWNKARVNGRLKPLRGLTKRRTAESKLYFSNM